MQKIYTMSLEIMKVVNEEDANNEYVRFKAKTNLNLEDYAVIDNTYLPNGGVSNVHRHFLDFLTS